MGVQLGDVYYEGGYGQSRAPDTATDVITRDSTTSGSSTSSGGSSGGSSYNRQAAEDAARREAERVVEQERIIAEQIRIADAQVEAAERAAQIESQRIQPAEQVTQVYEQPAPNITIQTKPYIEKRVTGEFKDPVSGKMIPITETVYVDPTVEGRQEERPATKEEKELVEESGGYFVSDKPRSPWQKITTPIIGTYESLNIDLKEAFTDPFADIIVESTKGTSYGGSTGLTLEKARENIQESTEYLKDKGVPSWVAETGEFTAGVGVGALEDVRDKPLKQVLIYGAGAAIGAGVKATEFGVTAIGTKFSNKAYSTIMAGEKVGFGTRLGLATPRVYQWGVNIAGAGVGGLYVASTAGKIAGAESSLEAGEITGLALKDIGLFAAGGVVGSKGAEKAYDFWRTKGRVELPLEDIGLMSITEVLSGQKKFVESSQFGGMNTAGYAKQQFDLKIFQRAGRAYSATPSQFWDKKIIASAGSSEFPGLYTAPSPSVYFLKAGGESGKIFGLYKGGGSPSVAVIEGGPSLFTSKGMQVGKGYITGIKPEIEAVFMEGTGLSLTGQQTFFKFAGRRIPMDIFKVTNAPTGGSVFAPSKVATGYSSYVGSSAAINPLTGFVAVTGSSSSYSPSSIKITAPSYTSSSSSSGTSSSYFPSYTSLSSGRSSSARSSSGGSSAGSSISSFISSIGSSSGSSRSYFPSSGSSGGSSPRIPSSKTPPLKLPSFKAKPLQASRQKGYNVQALDKGKWHTLNKKPLTRSAAKSLGARATDNTTSKRFRIQPSRKKGIVKSGGMYWATNQSKFRPYKVRKGQKVPLRETYIEKTSFGIDTRGEKKGLSVAKWKAQQSKTLFSNNVFAPTKKLQKKYKGGRLF